MIKNVYISMNGVFTDFDSYYATCAPLDPDQYHRFYEVITHVRIYDRLGIIEGSFELVKYFNNQPFNTQILTSTETNIPKLVMETKLQRTRWLLKHGFPFKPVFVNSQFEKCNYASPDSVLISNNSTAVSTFIMKGGKAIYHENVNSTILEFQKLINQEQTL